MSRILTLSLIALSAAAIPAQSGRRVEQPDTPAAAVKSPPSEAAGQGYSESKPVRRRNTPSASSFPAKPSSDASASAKFEKPAEAHDGDVIRVDTDLITIPVSVFDRNGLYVPNLTRDDFKIFEDGVEQEIAYFGTTDKPFTVILLLDTSLSTTYKIEEIRAAATAFVDQLKSEDSVMVIEFDGNVHVLTEATNIRPKIYKAINKADFGSGTSLYDAVDFSLRKRLSKVTGRKAIVLFTDGVDTTSTKAGYDTTLNLAEEADALVFPIYYNTFAWNNSRINRSPFPRILNPIGTRPEDYQLGRQYLVELAEYTGGRVFRPEATPGGLTAAFEGIAEELRRQYNIGYVPPEKGSVGQRKQIRVRVDRPNLILRARDSYVVGSSASPPTPNSK